VGSANDKEGVREGEGPLDIGTELAPYGSSVQGASTSVKGQKKPGGGGVAKRGGILLTTLHSFSLSGRYAGGEGKNAKG